MFSPLLILPMLTQVSARLWPMDLRIDFQWYNPNNIEYVFETVEPYENIAWPDASPSYSQDDTPIENSDNFVEKPAANTIAQLIVKGDIVSPGNGTVDPIDIWWTPDWRNKEVVRQRCSLVFTGYPETDMKYDLAVMQLSARFEAHLDQKVRDVTSFTCVDDPVEE